MIEEILPTCIASAEEFDDPPHVALFAEEEAAVARAVEKRRREFATGRHCARAALAVLGLPPAPVLRGERGAPRWPDGIVGSITHCDGYRAAAAARGRDVLTVGLDAEPDQPLPDLVLGAISGPAERAMLSALAATAPGTCWDRLLFSAKESVYKAWFPLTGRWLGFTDAVVTVSPADGTFEARLLVTGAEAGGRPLTSFAGRWLARNGLLVTAVTAVTAEISVP
jgi:4'-phosphopantetheinyl transferase EntD